MINGHGDDIKRYDGIRINFSSNVYSHFSHDGLKAWLADTMGDIVNYPEPEPLAAERVVAETVGVTPQEVMLTNGATEAIYLIAQATAGSTTAIVTPTFAEYADACRMHRHSITPVKALSNMPAESETVWLCTPNNPTGTVTPAAQLIEYGMLHPDTLFVVDASYAPFTTEPTLTPAEGAALPNMLMIHSMTKAFAVPGLRLGYITGCATLINRVRQYRQPWAVGTVAQNACSYLMSHGSSYMLPVGELMQERRRVGKALAMLTGIEVLSSQSHIMLCRWKNGNVADLKEILARRYGILIRDASNFEGLDCSHFRIAVQTEEENDELIRALTEITETTDNKQ